MPETTKNGELLSLAGRSTTAAGQFVSDLAADHRSVDLPTAERAMLDYAMTATPRICGSERVAVIGRTGRFAG